MAGFETVRNLIRKAAFSDKKKEVSKNKVDRESRKFQSSFRKRLEGGAASIESLSAEQLFLDAGWTDFIKSTQQGFTEFANKDPFLFTEKVDVPSSSLFKPLASATLYTLTALNQIKDSVLGPLQAMLEAQSSLGAPIKDIYSFVSPFVKKALKQARIVVDTSTSGLQTDIQVDVGKDKAKSQKLAGEEFYYLYMGPEGDKIIRPFCGVLVGLAVPESLVSKLNNGQGLPVRRSLGGYNCRHTWVIVTLKYVIDQGITIATMSDIRAANSAARS